MGGGINFDDMESVRLYGLALREKILQVTGGRVEVLVSTDTVLLLFSGDPDEHSFKLRKDCRTETKRRKVINYDTVEEWENEIIETAKLYVKAGLDRQPVYRPIKQ